MTAWITHDGTCCPEDGDTILHPRFRNGEVFDDPDHASFWDHADKKNSAWHWAPDSLCDSDIVAYSIVERKR